ncbi:MAG TPA: hypothetical protein VK171_16985, partial [Fimbriimonas sp.]|nr:hypothetical protein [Fimbriimonas sp.]
MQPEVFHHRNRLQYLLFLVYVLFAIPFVEMMLGAFPDPAALLGLAIIFGGATFYALVIANVRVEVDGPRVRQFNLLGKVVVDDLVANATNVQIITEAAHGSVTATFPSGKVSIGQ